MLAEIAVVLSLIAIVASVVFNLYLMSRNKTQDLEKHEARLTALETKVGLFWSLVEDHMSKFLLTANPIHLSEDEKAAALAYYQRKAQSPTYVLRKLESALDRELKNKADVPRDEVFTLTMILSAIKAQLVDRGEQVWR